MRVRALHPMIPKLFWALTAWILLLCSFPLVAMAACRQLVDAAITTKDVLEQLEKAPHLPMFICTDLGTESLSL